MKKSFVFLLSVVLAGAVYGGSLEKARAVEGALQKAQHAPCYTLACYDKAVKTQNWQKIRNTFFHATLDGQDRFLRQGVKVKDRVVSVPEYYIAQGNIGEELAELLPFWVEAYKGDKALWADNLLEKLSLDNHHPYQMQMAQNIIKELNVKSVSNRTFMYAAAQAVNAAGLEYFKLIAGLKRNNKNVSDRDLSSYPMPYALEGQGVCAVLSARMQTAEPEGFDYLRQAKVVAGCLLANPQL